jgi:hypothetical protein
LRSQAKAQAGDAAGADRLVPFKCMDRSSEVGAAGDCSVRRNRK